MAEALIVLTGANTWTMKDGTPAASKIVDKLKASR